VEYNVNANLEKVSVKHKEKDKIIENIKKNKKDLINTLEVVSTSVEGKEGFLYVKTKDSSEYFKKRYFKIHNGNLIYFKIKKGSDLIDISKNYTLCNLLLSNVKKNDKEYELPFCFEIISVSSKKTYLLQAETEYIAEEWFNNLRNAIANSISVYKDSPTPEANSPTHNHLDSSKDNLIERLIASTKCTDCDADSPTWCSINWLCLICIDCSGVHRSLGVQISKIRSLRLDNMEPELTELIDTMKQEKINKVLEELAKSYDKPKPNSLYNEKEVYITNKYKAKKFMKIPNRNDNRQELPAEDYYAQNVFRFIEKDDLINIYHYVKLELCDLNKLYEYEKDKYSFLHHSAKLGRYNVFKLLVILGADLQVQDSKNFKAIDYATMYKNVKFILIIV
jgi:Arf-GAP/coiled-coil/ANK repeat/PH domain-containing protein